MFALERWLARAQVQGIKLGLDNIRAALLALGQPQRQYPSVLVGGTNGKGSTVTMAAAILAAMELRIGSTISPHLSDYRERLLLNGEVIPQRELEALGARVAARLDGAPGCEGITYFELGVALALRWFAEQRVDAAVVEVGMGGEFDATRGCEPVAAALVSIDLDHVKHLGPGLLDIARTKARVAMPGGILVVGEQRADRLAPVRDEAHAAGCDLWQRGRHFALEPGADGLCYRGPGLEVPGITLGLTGAHQEQNAAVAVALVQALAARSGIPTPTPDAVRRGLAEARLAGRQEERRIGSVPVLLDGAHNPAGAATLAASLETRPRPPRRIWLFAAMEDKERGPLLELLLPFVDEVWCTRGASTPRYADPATLLAEVEARGGRGEVVGSPAEALDEVRGLSDAELLVAGSLYLVGDLRPLLDDESSTG